MSWYCGDCKMNFDAPFIVLDRMSDPPGVQKFPVCPKCFGDEITENVTCVKCGGEYRKESLVSGLCPTCRMAAAHRFGTSMRRFTEEERRFLYGLTEKLDFIPRSWEEYTA